MLTEQYFHSNVNMRDIVIMRENNDELFNFKDNGTRDALSNMLTCRQKFLEHVKTGQ